MNELLRWLADRYRLDSATLESVLTITWFYLVLGGLWVIAAVLLSVMIARKRYNRRMSRATFGLVLGFALVVTRTYYLSVMPGTDVRAIPQPWALMFWTYQVISVVYMLYAMMLGWIIPGIWRIAIYLGIVPPEEEISEEDAEPV